LNVGGVMTTAPTRGLVAVTLVRPPSDLSMPAACFRQVKWRGSAVICFSFWVDAFSIGDNIAHTSDPADIDGHSGCRPMVRRRHPRMRVPVAKIRNQRAALEGIVLCERADPKATSLTSMYPGGETGFPKASWWLPEASWLMIGYEMRVGLAGRRLEKSDDDARNYVLVVIVPDKMLAMQFV